jgi:hypothetical protein
MTRCSRHRGGYAAAMALVGLLAMAACGGHSGPPGPPKAGQARVIGQAAADGDIDPEESSDTQGVAAGAGGTVYVDTREHLVRVGTDGKFADASGRQAGRPAPEHRGLHGLVVRSDGALLAGEDGQLVAVAPDGRITVLAGTAGRFRSLTAPVAKSAAAVGFRFFQDVTPLGVEKDGTVVIADGNVVWSLSGGRLAQRYRQAPVKSTADLPRFVGVESTADPDGTVFLAPGSDTAALADVVVLPGDGQAPHKLTVPARLPSAGVPTAELKTGFLAGDGADGVYAEAFRTKGTGSYVLHVHGGQIDVVASSTASALSDTCGVHRSVAARDFPCYLPEGIAYRAGHVYLAGQRSYVLDIAVPAS